MLNIKEGKVFCIQPTIEEDIPRVLELIKSEPTALLSVTQDQMELWIELGQTLVAKTRSGLLVAHQAASVWPESSLIEGRAAIVDPKYRGYRLGSLMKSAIDSLMQLKYPGKSFVSFTESGSGIRNIVQRMGYKELPLVEVHPELFTACPENCFLKIGIDCGCKVYLKEVTTKE